MLRRQLGHRWSTMCDWQLGALLSVYLCSSGCATGGGTCPAFATLEHTGSESHRGPAAQVAVNGAAVDDGPMPLQRGDVVNTGPDTRAIITFATGGRAVLGPNTKVRLSSLWTWFGNLFVSGPINTKTAYAAAAVQGTKYHVAVEEETKSTTFTVIEGRVRLSSPKAAWAPLVLRGGERAAVSKPGQAPRPQRLTPEELESLTEQFYAEFHAMEPDQSAVLPDVRDLEVARARHQLHGRGIRTVERPTASTSKIGRVISQSPKPGMRTDSVVLTVGARGVEIPDLVGKSRMEAEIVLKATQLAPGNVKAWDESDAAVIVLQSPPARSRMLTGQRVDLILGALQGKPQLADQAVPVPDVTGASWDAANKSLYAAGLAATIVHEDANATSQAPRTNLRRPRIIGQSPLPGHRLGRGKSVQLVVAYPGAAVPTVEGDTAQVAQHKLEVAGLTAKIVWVGGKITDDSRIVLQLPAAGTALGLGEPVTVVMTDAATRCITPPIDDLLRESSPPSQLKAAIERRLAGAGLRAEIRIAPGPGELFKQASQHPEVDEPADCGESVTVTLVPTGSP